MKKLFYLLLSTFISLTALAGIGTPYPVPSGQMIVGDAKAKGQNVTLSGDVTVSNAGVTTIGANAIDSDSYIDGSIDEEHHVAATADGLHVARWARATLDCGTASCVAGDVSMGVTIPANAVLLRAFYYTVTQFVDGGAGTVALKCEDAGNIDAAADITGIAAGAITQTDLVAGAEVAAISASCVISATVAVAEQTAGKLILYVQYVIAE